MNSVSLIKLLISVGIIHCFAGCYYVKQGLYVLKYQLSAKNIDTLLKDKKTPDELSDFLQTVNEIRTYAFDEIGLNKNSNYSRYVQIQNDYLIDVVYAACKDTFSQYMWNYPFMGKMPYKGYFDSGDAQIEAKRLSKKGFDVYVGKVDGYSTLGILSDPVYSFMHHYSLFSLASLIFHEQTHATLFVKGYPQFNEELAQFIGIKGAKLFFEKKFGSDSEQYSSIQLWLDDYATYNLLQKNLYVSLDSLYKSGLDSTETLKRKEIIINEFKEYISNHYALLFKTTRFQHLPQRVINNANLMIQMTYTMDLDLFETIFNDSGKSMKEFLRKIKKVSSIKGDPKEYLIKTYGKGCL